MEETKESGPAPVGDEAERDDSTSLPGGDGKTKDTSKTPPRQGAAQMMPEASPISADEVQNKHRDDACSRPVFVLLHMGCENDCCPHHSLKALPVQSEE
jgi:hypothetical protein